MFNKDFQWEFEREISRVVEEYLGRETLQAKEGIAQVIVAQTVNHCGLSVVISGLANCTDERRLSELTRILEKAEELSRLSEPD